MTMKRRNFCLALGSALVLPGGGKPAPLDLAVQDMEIIPDNPAPGEKVAIIVHVKNNSASKINAFNYDFREDVLDATPSFQGKEGVLGPGDVAEIFIPHVFGWWGPFIPEVRIDTTSQVAETDEFNNSFKGSLVTNDDPFVLAFKDLPAGRQIWRRPRSRPT